VVVASAGGNVGGRRSGLDWLVSLGHIDGLDNSLDDKVDILDLLGLTVAVARDSEGRASEGGDGESGAHVDGFGFVCLVGMLWEVID
jgi:hypothetical protein